MRLTALLAYLVAMLMNGSLLNGEVEAKGAAAGLVNKFLNNPGVSRGDIEDPPDVEEEEEEEASIPYEKDMEYPDGSKSDEEAGAKPKGPTNKSDDNNLQEGNGGNSGTKGAVEGTNVDTKSPAVKSDDDGLQKDDIEDPEDVTEVTKTDTCVDGGECESNGGGTEVLAASLSTNVVPLLLLVSAMLMMS
ncbi:uncharacterized protein TEOVI_000341300 [Trypanosoma equiperdum]|uniref:Uncharacterized protein n=2 Tax=Trypanozoon TaxID=39700 RepID=Q38DA1_TRYB2|nr:hypothetical protein Tb09.211.4070 [Trypanosoma brucei brucei TREU927]EAN77219.1 hypothetical protein Tb09.211.4070 [Trypanosoma brucei brucei TREU927]SCU71831.1 hypothetical protein, conserved [Trypanosoma equiperdum]